MTLSSVVRMVRLRWRTFVIVVVACAVVGFAVALIAPNRYVSSVQLLVTAKGSSTAQSYQNMEIETARATSYLALLRSQVVNQRVVDDVHLPYSAQTLSDRINAALVPKTTIIDVQVAGDTADQARAAADSLAKQFVAYTKAVEEPTGPDDQRVQTTIVSTATEPVRERPGAWVFGLLGALVGVVLGVAAAWIRSRTDPIVRISEDAAAAAGLPVLGTLGDDTDPAATKGIRVLQHRRAGVDPGSRVWHTIIVAEGVGVTDLATTFARSVVAAGGRILVIAPETSESALSVTTLRQIISGEVDIDEVSRNTDDPSTDIVYAGESTCDPLGAAEQTALRRIFDDLSKRYEAIVIGTASSRLSPNQTAASACADGTVLVAVGGRTRRSALAGVSASLRASGTTPVGVILAGRRAGEDPAGSRTTEPTEEARPARSGTA